MVFKDKTCSVKMKALPFTSIMVGLVTWHCGSNSALSPNVQLPISHTRAAAKQRVGGTVNPTAPYKTFLLLSIN